MAFAASILSEIGKFEIFFRILIKNKSIEQLIWFR